MCKLKAIIMYYLSTVIYIDPEVHVFLIFLFGHYGD